jgi:hypothetical protein
MPKNRRGKANYSIKSRQKPHRGVGIPPRTRLPMHKIQKRLPGDSAIEPPLPDDSTLETPLPKKD